MATVREEQYVNRDDEIVSMYIPALYICYIHLKLDVINNCEFNF